MKDVCLLSGFLANEDRCAVGQYTEKLYSSMVDESSVQVDYLNFRSQSGSDWFKMIHRLFNEYRIVHVQYPLEAWGRSIWPGIAPGLTRLVHPDSKLVMTFHEWGSTHPLRKLSFLPNVFMANTIVTAARQVRDEVIADRLVRWNPLPPNVEFIPIGSNLDVVSVEPQHCLETRKRYGFNEQTRFIGYFGFLYAWKQPEKLLDLAASLKARGENTKLLMFGDFPVDHVAKKHAYLEEIKSRGLSDYIEYMGFIEDTDELTQLIGACDAVVQLFADGLTTRRSSFWAVLNVGTPLISTQPVNPDEFLGVLDLEKLQRDNKLMLVNTDAGMSEVVDLFNQLPPYEVPSAANRSPGWHKIGEMHLQLYRQILSAGGQTTRMAS